MTYDDLLIEADRERLIVKEKYLINNDGRIKGRRIAIRRDIPLYKAKACVLAEEMGHYYVNSGNILDQSDTANRKQEYKARLCGYNKMIGLMGLVDAYKNGCSDIHETAEFLNVTEEYLIDAISCYRSKYGVFATVDNYIVYFIPSLCIYRVCESLP